VSDPIRQLQEDVVARLRACEFFSDLNVFLLREQTIETKINQALSVLTGKDARIGAAVSVLMPLFDVPAPNVPGPQGSMIITVRCQEHPLFNLGPNGTGKSAERIAIEALKALHHFTLQGVAGTLAASNEALSPSRDFLPLITYDVILTCKLAVPNPDRVMLPAASVAVGADGGKDVTLTEVTPGTTIYYTTDLTFPDSVNGAPYTAPINLPSGVDVRWAGYKAGLLPSDVGKVTT